MQRGLDAAAGPREGDILAGKYRIERVLGIGGMGVVVAALHLELETHVAIKFLLPEMLASPEAVQRFAREARAAVKIKSEHVARVYDVGTLDSGAPFMVMELLEGGDLAEWLSQRGPTSLDQAVDFLLQACVAVADAHGIGIIHRDLKPANLFCVRRSDGQLIIKVLDFGISKLTRISPAGPVSVTQTTNLMGSPLYMSPEQLRSTKNADVQSDIWSLGVILFELLTGRTPFDGETLSNVSIVIATEPAPLLRSLRSEAPAGLEAVVSRCLEKDPKARYRDVSELAAALLPFAPVRSRALVERIAGIVHSTRTGVPSIPPPFGTTITSSLPTSTADPVGSTVARFPPRRRAALVVSLGIVAAVSAGTAVVLWRGAPPRAVGSMGPVSSVVSVPATPVPPAPPPAVAAESAAPPVPPPTGEPAPPATAEAVLEVPAAAPSAAAPPSPPPRAAPPVPRRARPKPASTSPAATTPAAAATPAPECNPPYYYDPNGTRVFKKECF